MEQAGVLLAANEGFGQIYDCGRCGNIHLQVGMVGLTLTPDQYMHLVSMVSTSAANFEMWLEKRSLKGISDENLPSDHGQD
jgi:hypothetical protein